jgi:uridine phosphorylase
MTPDLGPVGEVDGAAWRSVLGLTEDEFPVAVIVEGTWWREERTGQRLSRLDRVRELGVPDVFIGSWASRPLIYACPYGAPRTAEVIHIAAQAGVTLAIQIGSCGVIGAGVRPGDVIVPTQVLGLDGVTPHYAAPESVAPESITSSEPWSQRAVEELDRRGIRVHRGPSVTWPTLFNQPVARVLEWQQEGYLGVDMETATTLSVAAHFGASGISMLVAWDEVLSGRSFLDPLPDAEADAFAASEDAIFDVALSLTAMVSEA